MKLKTMLLRCDSHEVRLRGLELKPNSPKAMLLVDLKRISKHGSELLRLQQVVLDSFMVNRDAVISVDFPMENSVSNERCKPSPCCFLNH